MRVTGPGQLVHLLLDIADLLNELRIPYAVVGALAVSFHGIPRATNDADTVIWLKEAGRTEEELANRLTQDVRGILQVSGKHLNVALLRQLASRYGADVSAKLENFLPKPKRK